jgi:predicted aspartyl protease
VQEAKVTHWSAGKLSLPADALSVTNLGKSGSGGLDGLLGSDVLSKYGQITVNYASGKLSLGTAAGLPGTNTSSVPLKVAHAKNGATLALAPVKVKGKGPFAFALDTGATTSTLDLAVTKKLNLPLHQTNREVSGVACSTNVKTTQVNNWQVGKLALPATTLDVVKFPTKGGGGLQGLLGSNILSDFGQITVDYAHGQLRLPAHQSGASASGSRSGGSVRLAVRRSGGSVLAVAPVRIGGHGPYPFAVDTGSPKSVVTTALARRLGLHKTGAAGQIHGVQGKQKAYAATVHRWRAGSVMLPAGDVVVTGLSSQHLEGLLGADVLASFGRVTVDYHAQRLELGKAASEQHATAVPVKVLSASGSVRITAPVTVSGHQTTFALDTGASRSAIAQKLAKQLGLSSAGTAAHLSGVTGHGTVPLVQVRHWKLGSTQLQARKLLAVPLQGHLKGLFGSDVLSTFGSITIDFGKGQLLLPQK